MWNSKSVTAVTQLLNILSLKFQFGTKFFRGNAPNLITVLNADHFQSCSRMRVLRIKENVPARGEIRQVSKECYRYNTDMTSSTRNKQFIKVCNGVRLYAVVSLLHKGTVETSCQTDYTVIVPQHTFSFIILF